MPAVTIAGITSVTLAYLGYGVWALAVQYLLLALVSSLILWIQQPAKIHFAFYKESFKNLFGFGYKLLLSGLLNTDRKSTRLNSSHVAISYAVFCLKKKSN